MNPEQEMRRKKQKHWVSSHGFLYHRIFLQIFGHDAFYSHNVQNKHGTSAERKKNEEMDCLERLEIHTEQTQQLFSL